MEKWVGHPVYFAPNKETTLPLRFPHSRHCLRGQSSLIFHNQAFQAISCKHIKRNPFGAGGLFPHLLFIPQQLLRLFKGKKDLVRKLPLKEC